MLSATLKKNDKQATWLIGIFSLVVFLVVTFLSGFKLDVAVGFDVHIFAMFNAAVNATIAVCLLAALVAVKTKHYQIHKNLMLAALLLSVLFLVSYIAHHLLAGEAKFADSNFDGVVSAAEKAAVGGLRTVYLVILATHIFLAAVILPFILFTAYHALTAEFGKHKRLARITWPLWFYVAVTGPIVYLMIKPYYH
jgi:putative membrane protein